MSDLSDLSKLADPFPVEPVEGPLDAVVTVPGSKSITNRALICAALADGTSVLSGALSADDTHAMVGVLAALGLDVVAEQDGTVLTVVGCGGSPPPCDATIDVRQSGTTARFVIPMLALGRGSYRVTAHPQMQARPMDTTFSALETLGGGFEPIGDAGHLPATIRGGGLRSGAVRVRGDASSQFLSGMLMIGPCLPDGLVVEVTSALVSQPYVELTVAVMKAFGAVVERPDPQTFAVLPGGYRPTRYQVEPDASAASYPLAAAAICGGTVRVEGLTRGSIQGDVAFVDVLAAMGAQVDVDDNGMTIRCERGNLGGGVHDLTHISDTAQTLAVAAPFAQSEVEVTGIGFIRHKETDRVAAVATELARCGVDVTVNPDGWTIKPGRPHGAVIQTYQDHRMAMSFALLGLVTPGISIADPACVAKTFPGYWELLGRVSARV